jgi:hypothetical protein
MLMREVGSPKGSLGTLSLGPDGAPRAAGSGSPGPRSPGPARPVGTADDDHLCQFAALEDPRGQFTYCGRTADLALPRICDPGNAGCKMTRLRSRSKPTRPSIWRLIVSTVLLAVPSTLPELQSRAGR